MQRPLGCSSTFNALKTPTITSSCWKSSWKCLRRIHQDDEQQASGHVLSALFDPHHAFQLHRNELATINTSFSFLPPSTPDSCDEMEVNHHNEQLAPFTVGLENEDPMDLDNESQNMTPRMPFGDVTARIENAQNPSAQARPATAPLRAGAVLIVSKRTSQS